MNQNRWAQYFPWLVGGLVVLFFGASMLPPRDGDADFHYRKFGRLPVIDGGRLKPMDTVARMNLMVITHRQAFHNPAEAKTYPATKWVLDSFMSPPPRDNALRRLFPVGDEKRVAWEYKIFRIENDQVLRLLDLKMREGLRYSLDEIAPQHGALAAEVKRIIGDEDENIRPVDPKTYTLFDAKVMELWQHLIAFQKLSGQGSLLTIPDPAGSDQWTSFRANLENVINQQPMGDGIDAKTFAFYVQLLKAYEANDPAAFNSALAKHLAMLDQNQPAKMQAIDVEIFFNEFAPFYRVLYVYGGAALLGCLAWIFLAFTLADRSAGWALAWFNALRRGAYSAMVIAFVVHLVGLIARMYLQDRLFVFVTNLYSSAVFIGLGCVVFCLIIEAIFKYGIALVAGSMTGFCTLIIAHILSLSGDTLEMMQAVLDTNFWLATHVTIITLGYTTALFAGFLGVAYIGLGIFTPLLRQVGSQVVATMIYGVLCAGMFLSFVGTVLGGLWADYSWGRFWGWDPKENGALLIVIWIALILHARWGGMIKQRGLAVLSVLSIIVTSWSWFGTNFLGVGLHSYGFRQGAMMWLGLIDLGFLSIAGLGAFLPLHLWQSFRPLGTPDTPIPKAILRPKPGNA